MDQTEAGERDIRYRRDPDDRTRNLKERG